MIVKPSPEAVARFAARYAHLVTLVPEAPPKPRGRKPKRKTVAPKASVPVDTRTCDDCGNTKKLTLFASDTQCLVCEATMRRMRTGRLMMKAPAPPPEPIGFSGKKKVCATCKKSVAVELFYETKQTLDGLQHSCSACFREYLRKWRAGEAGAQVCKVCNKPGVSFDAPRARVCIQCKAERGKYYNRTARERYAKRKAQKNAGT